MNISYDSYRVFYYAAKYQSFTQAASVLGGNQPNITRTIRNLESSLGCRLFARSNRGVGLTPEGERLYAHIAQAVAHIQAGEAEIASSQGLREGVVTVAATEIALRCCLLPVLKDFRVRYPGVRVRLTSCLAPQAMEALRDGLADFAAVTAPRHMPKTLRRHDLMEIQEIPVAGTAYDFLRGRRLTLRQLTEYPLIGLGPNTATMEFFGGVFSGQGAAFRPDIEAATADQILPMVKSGLGIGFVPESFAEEDILAGNVLALALEEAVPRRAVCLLEQEGRPLSVAARELRRMMVREF